MTLRVTTGVKVGDAIGSKPITVTKDKTVHHAANMMTRKKIGALLVTEAGKFVGIVTERDLVRKSLTKDKCPTKQKVADVMNKRIVTIKPEEDINEAMRVMRDYEIRHLPVISQGKIVGLVTTKDVLAIQPDLYEIMRDRLQMRFSELAKKKKTVKYS